MGHPLSFSNINPWLLSRARAHSHEGAWKNSQPAKTMMPSEGIHTELDNLTPQKHKMICRSQN
jgi:hypothetical protein